MYEIIKNLKDNDGLTLKGFSPIQYKSGYQVATEGIKRKTIKAVINAIKRYNGNCGVWFSNGIYYIDKSHRVATKKEAVKVGIEHNQISILKWSDMSLVYC